MTDPHPALAHKSTIVRSIQTGLRATATLSPGLAARWASALFFRAPQRPIKPAEAEILAIGTPVSLRHRGAPLAGWSWGSGPTALLVHGWGGNAAQLTGFVAPLRARGFRVVALDLPGHGRSSGRTSSIPEMAEALEAWRVHHGPPVAVIAHSLGVCAAMLALERSLETGRFAGIAGPAAPIRWFDAWVGATVSPEVLAAERDRVGRQLGVSLQSLDGRRLAGLRSEPALFVHDRDDKEVAAADSEVLAAAWRGAELQLTSGLGHKRILADPAVLARVADFLAPRPERAVG